MTEKSIPRPEDVQKEFESFFKQRFGSNVQVFTSQMNQDRDQDGQDDEKNSSQNGEWNLDFHYKPKDIKSYLDRYVIQQEEAKIALSIAVCDHYNHARLERSKDSELDYEYAKQNVLILGPTGVGKTYLIRKVADLIGVPFVKADATRFSETGYVGANADDLIRDLVQQADGDIERAQYGIVYLDEADKLASPKNQMGRDVTGRGVQFSLLRLMEETEVDLKSGNDIQSQIQALMDMQKKKSSRVNTKNILFIVSGAFSGLGDIVRKRLNKQPIGFHGSHHVSDTHDDTYFLQQAATQDFVDYGFEPEFIGRLPVRVACEHLSPEDLYHILQNSEGSIIKQYEASFRAYGIDLRFDTSALRRIAEKAFAEKTGARALMTVCESIMRKFKYELPSSHIRSLTVDAATIDDPGQNLERVLKQPDMSRYEDAFNDLVNFQNEFLESFGITLHFTDELAKKIANHSVENGLNAYSFVKELLASYHHGLALVRSHTGQSEFAIPAEAFKNPDQVLEELIRKSYGSESLKSSPQAPQDPAH